MNYGNTSSKMIITPKIFLAGDANVKSAEAQRLRITLERAGFAMNDPGILLSDPMEYSCSVHFIGKNFIEASNGTSMDEIHFNRVQEAVKQNTKFKTIIWMLGETDYSDADKKQLESIERVQNRLSNHMILSRAPSAIQFVEDVRLIIEQHAKKIYETEPADIFLICNQVDEKEALRIQTMLSGIVNLVKLVIVQDSDIDYEEYSAQQMNVSKLPVIYYKNAPDWALPFVQQIWKRVGGASSRTPILFAGDASVPANEKINFKAPRVTSFVLPPELIPLEIKVQYDALSEKS